ncbi:hypothetical protein D3C79_896740 [compost metagenome]
MPFLHYKDEIGLLAERAGKLARNMSLQGEPMLQGHLGGNLIGWFINQGVHPGRTYLTTWQTLAQQALTRRGAANIAHTHY